ncbi:FAD-binding oxidoreductase [Desulfosediminicola flagellatus]|uniref:FAD-binding oxidoreductase n=1 Tax=Desulfosediminicola flagellatus TaxID=2569541 RepID=UPI0010AC9B10|nr:FAD-binding oxidoreductase [Desulfosediminicola flagellatus]
MNEIQPVSCEAAECNVISDQSIIHERYTELLGDESKLRAENVHSIYVPTSTAEVVWAVQDMISKGHSCVISAGRTGIAGGAVPLGVTSILCLDQLKSPLGLAQEGDAYAIRVEPGMSLARLTGLVMRNDFNECRDFDSAEHQEASASIADKNLRLWFPVNPTETSAHIGGIVATNASGARSYRYGATRKWVRGLTVILADGRLLKIRRGDVVAEGGCFVLHEVDGSKKEIQSGEVSLPATKATLGYPLAAGMDLIDLFIGSEGTLGVITEIELYLSLRPEASVGVLVIAPDEETALGLVENSRSNTDVNFDAIEYFDPAAFQLIKEKKDQDGAGSHIPDLPNWQGCGVYFEFSGTEEETEEACIPLEEILEQSGLSLDDTWAAMEPAEMAAQRIFRHAVPEAVNGIIGRRKLKFPGLHKVGTDMAVPNDKLREVFAMYRQGLESSGIDSVIFGHIGDNHVHVNLLPKDMEELARSKQLYLAWAENVVTMGGAVAAEHGIGRMKKEMLQVQYAPKILNMMKAVRTAFDPNGVFAPGVLFE